MHAWSLGTIAEATAYTGLGVDFHLENRRAVLFMLLARRRDASGPNDPVKAFMLEGGGLVGKDKQSFLRAHWPRLKRTCKIMTDAMRVTLDEAEQYAFAGFIPAAFHFKTTGIVAFHQFPLFRLRAHGCGPLYGYHSVAKNNTLFDDVARLWGLLVNRGLLFRARYNDNEPVLAAELCTWSGKSWERVLSDRKWDTEDVVLDSPEPSQYSSGLSPATIYKRYHKFLARRNFRFVTTRRQKLIFTVGKKGDISAINATSGSTLEVDVETEQDK